MVEANSNTGFVGARVSPEVKAKLEALAKEQGVSMNELMSKFLERVSGKPAVAPKPALRLSPEEEQKVELLAESVYRAVRRIIAEEEDQKELAKLASEEEENAKKNSNTFLDIL